MSECKWCGAKNPVHGLDADGWCFFCCSNARRIFIPYSGRRPSGDAQIKCPACGAPLDGVFLCRYCERQAEEQLREIAFREEWDKHQAERWKRGYIPKADPHWLAITQELLDESKIQ